MCNLYTLQIKSHSGVFSSFLQISIPLFTYTFLQRHEVHTYTRYIRAHKIQVYTLGTCVHTRHKCTRSTHMHTRHKRTRGTHVTQDTSVHTRHKRTHKVHTCRIETGDSPGSVPVWIYRCSCRAQVKNRRLVRGNFPRSRGNSLPTNVIVLSLLYLLGSCRKTRSLSFLQRVSYGPCTFSVSTDTCPEGDRFRLCLVVLLLSLPNVTYPILSWCPLLLSISIF